MRDPAADGTNEDGTNEYEASVENGPPDLHRQVDTEDFVFSEREALSTRPIAPPARKRFPADAYQDSSQSRIRWISRPTRD